MSKDYSNLNTLAMGEVSDEDLAANVVHQNRDSNVLASVLRAAHDRILHLSQKVSTQAAELTSFYMGVSVQSESQASFETLAEIMANSEGLLEGTVNLCVENPCASAELPVYSDIETQINETVNASTGDLQETPAQVLVVVMPEVTNEQIQAVALTLGFRTRKQAIGPDDLNPYVYAFARQMRGQFPPQFAMVDISSLPRYAVFEQEDGIYSAPNGSYTLFHDVRKMIEDSVNSVVNQNELTRQA